MRRLALILTLGLAGHSAAMAQSPKTCGAASSSPDDVVQAQVDAYNAHDVDRFASCYADDVTLKSLAGDRPDVKGIEALKTTYKFLTTAPKEFGVEVVKRVVNGPIVVYLERVHGRAANSTAPTDSSVVYEVRNGKIVSAWFPPRQ